MIVKPNKDEVKVVYDKIKLLEILDNEITDEKFIHPNKYAVLKHELNLVNWRLVGVEQLVEKNLFKMFGPAYREFFNRSEKMVFMYNYMGKKLASVVIRGLKDKEFMDVSISSSCIYGLNELPDNFLYGDVIIVTEGLYDCEVMREYINRIGYKAYPIALLTSGLSNKKADLLTTITDSFIINPDNDDAGDGGARKTVEMIKKHGIKKSGRVKIGVLNTPKVLSGLGPIKDIGDCYPINEFVLNHFEEKLKSGLMKLYREED